METQKTLATQNNAGKVIPDFRLHYRAIAIKMKL